MSEYKNINIKIPISLYQKIKGIECITGIKIKKIVIDGIYLYIKKYLESGVNSDKGENKSKNKKCC